MTVLLKCVYVYHLCPVPVKARRGHQPNLLELELEDSSELGTESSPLHDHCEPSLQAAKVTVLSTLHRHSE